MNTIETSLTPNSDAIARHPLPAHLELEPGCIITVRMRGHSRTQGQEYFAPAVVLEQFEPSGDLSILIWDASAGTHYNNSYPVRDVGVRGDGAMREQFEIRSNIGELLFSPRKMEDMLSMLKFLSKSVDELFNRLDLLDSGSDSDSDSKPSTRPNAGKK